MHHLTAFIWDLRYIIKRRISSTLSIYFKLFVVLRQQGKMPVKPIQD